MKKLALIVALGVIPILSPQTVSAHHKPIAEHIAGYLLRAEVEAAERALKFIYPSAEQNTSTTTTTTTTVAPPVTTTTSTTTTTLPEPYFEPRLEVYFDCSLDYQTGVYRWVVDNSTSNVRAEATMGPSSYAIPAGDIFELDGPLAVGQSLTVSVQQPDGLSDFYVEKTISPPLEPCPGFPLPESPGLTGEPTSRL